MSQEDFVFTSPADFMPPETVQAQLELPAETVISETGAVAQSTPDVLPGETLNFGPNDALLAAAARARDAYEVPFVGLDGENGAGPRSEGEL